MRDIRGHHVFIDNLNESSIVIDLGAYEGDFARTISSETKAHVYSVEANPNVFPRTYSSENVKKFNLAISDHRGTVKLYLAGNPEGNSICLNHRDVSAAAFVEVPSTTLKDFLRENGISRVDVLKVDIEGAEVQLFKTLDNEMLKEFKQISVEFHDFIPGLEIDNDVRLIKSRLRALGFKCIIFRKPNIDVLFINVEKSGINFWVICYCKILQKFSLEISSIVAGLTKAVKGILRIE